MFRVFFNKSSCCEWARLFWFKFCREGTRQGAMSYLSAALLPMLPWEIRHHIVAFAAPRCDLCDEGKAVLTKTSNGFELWCLRCVLGMLPDVTCPPLVDGITRGVHSFSHDLSDMLLTASGDDPTI